MSQLKGGLRGGATESAITALNVKNYGAVGDGKQDDASKIQNALDAVGAGNTVFFPPGNYAISKSLKPKSKTQLLGVHVPVYSTGPEAKSACKISLLSGKDFTGGAAIESDGAFGVEIRNLALDGFGQSKNPIHGIDQGRKAGERGWSLEHVTIHGFNGSGLVGRWHVATLYDVHVACNAGWGVDAGTKSSNWNDVRFMACQFYYNGQGNVWLGGTTQRSAAIEFIGCRSERAGINREHLFKSIVGAPGWRISRGARINLVGCSTDANAGNGVEIVPIQGDDAANLYLIQIVGSSFGRDGCLGVDGVVPDRAGIKVMAANQVRIVGCSINTGSGRDVGVPDHALDPAATVDYVEGPKYGIWCSDIHYVDIVANNVQGKVKDFRIESTAYRGNIQDMRNGLFTIPDRGQGDLPDPSMLRPGMTIWHAGKKKPLWYDGSKWLDAMGAAATQGE